MVAQPSCTLITVFVFVKTVGAVLWVVRGGLRLYTCIAWEEIYACAEAVVHAGVVQLYYTSTPGG